MVVEEGEEKREDAVEEEAKGDSLVVSTLVSAVVVLGVEAVAVSKSSRLASFTERVPPVVLLLLGVFPFLPFWKTWREEGEEGTSK